MSKVEKTLDIKKVRRLVWCIYGEICSRKLEVSREIIYGQPLCLDSPNGYEKCYKKDIRGFGEILKCCVKVTKNKCEPEDLLVLMNNLKLRSFSYFKLLTLLGRFKKCNKTILH